MELYSQGCERSYTVNASILRTIEPHLKDFQQLLLDPPKVSWLLFFFSFRLLILICCSFNPRFIFLLWCRKVQYSQLLVFWSSLWGTHAFMWPGWWPPCCRPTTAASAKSSAGLTPWTFCWWGIYQYLHCISWLSLVMQIENKCCGLHWVLLFQPAVFRSGCRIYSSNTPGITSCTFKLRYVWHRFWTTLLTRVCMRRFSRNMTRTQTQMAWTAVQMRGTHPPMLPWWPM